MEVALTNLAIAPYFEIESKRQSAIYEVTTDMQIEKSYVRQDGHGVMRVAETRVMLDSVIASFDQGCSAETIAQQYPALTLEEVYGAITYYLAHTDEVNQYLQNQKKVWEQRRHQADQQASAVVQRLREQSIRTETDAK